MRFVYKRIFAASSPAIPGALPIITVPALTVKLVVGVPYPPRGVLTDLVVKSSNTGSAFTVDLLNSKVPFDPFTAPSNRTDDTLPYPNRQYRSGEDTPAAPLELFRICPTLTASSGVAKLAEQEYEFANMDSNVIGERYVYLLISGVADTYQAVITCSPANTGSV